MKIKKILAFAIVNALIISVAYNYSITYAIEDNNILCQEQNTDTIDEELEETTELKTFLPGISIDSLTHPDIFKSKPYKEEVYDGNGDYCKTVYYEYDENRNLIQKNDTNGEKEEYKYNAQGYLINYTHYYTDDLNKTPSVKLEYEYSQEIIDGKKTINIYTYGYNGYQERDLVDCSELYYDNNDRLIKYTYGAANQDDYFYDVDGKLTKIRSSELGYSPYSYTYFEYDSNNNLSKENDKDFDVNYTYSYDNYGNLIKREALSYDKYRNSETSYYYYDNTITTTGIYCASNYPSIQAGINVQKGNLGDTVEYRWVACNNKNPDQWFEVSPWTRDNNWINWTPEESGGYVFVCYARVVGNEEESMIQSSFGTEYHKHIKGICQMPYTGPGGGYLIGIESYDNPNHSYKYEMLILDCNLYMQGKDAWVYTTGKCGAPENCLWTIWQPQYGYYWTLFRIYDSNDNLIDEACYGFENVY